MMNKDNSKRNKSTQLNRLAKTDPSESSITVPKSNFRYNIRKIGSIVKSLSKPSSEYLPEKTVDSILQYTQVGDRIFYSELTNLVYTMSSEERDIFSTNLEKLLEYSRDESNNVSSEVYKVVVRLWDHFNLARYQIENIQKVIVSSTGEIRDSVYKQLLDKFKGIEKEYITILGIFASIVLAFIGGLTFSTSVLEHMKDVGVYRLLLVVILIGFVLINTINILLQYIFKLNNREDSSVPIWIINCIFGALALIVIVAWALSAHNLPDFLSRWMPWY